MTSSLLSPNNSGLRHKGWNQNRKWPRPGNVGSNGVIEAASAPVLRGNLSPRQHVFPLARLLTLSLFLPLEGRCSESLPHRKLKIWT